MKKLIFILFLVISTAIYAQNVPDFRNYQVRINEDNKNILAEIKPVESISVEADRIYYWYSANQIKQTLGGYSGHLLNGRYSEFYLNKNLKEQGEFNKGLKSGIWKSWTEDGILIQHIIWKNGFKNGTFVLYDEKGNISQKGNYKNNLLNGNQYTYKAGSTPEITKYKDGNVAQKSAPSHFWSKLNIFKKKGKPGLTQPKSN